MVYFISKKDIDRFMNSRAKKEMDEKFLLVEETFNLLDEQNRRECREYAEAFIEKGEARYKEVSEGTLDEDLLRHEEAVEHKEIAVHMIEWFPFVGNYPQKTQERFALFFLQFIWELKNCPLRKPVS